MNTLKNNQRIEELNGQQLEKVCGGVNFGTGAGGLFSIANVSSALRFAGGLGLIYQSGKLGWDIGSYGYSAYSRYKYSTR